MNVHSPRELAAFYGLISFMSSCTGGAIASAARGFPLSWASIIGWFIGAVLVAFLIRGLLAVLPSPRSENSGV